MQQWWIVLLQSLIIQRVVDGSPILTPEAVHSCRGETVTFICVVTNGDRLYWEVEYSDPSWSDVSTLRYSVTDNQGKIIPHTNNVGHTIKFNLTDNTHLTSTATTTVVQEMNGTKVYCREAVNNRADAVIYVVNGPPEFDGNIIVNKLTIEDNYYSVNVSWISIRPGVDEQYIIAITPPVESGSNFTTSNTSIILSVLYSQEYNISIMASNCAGSSARVTVIGVCEYPAVGTNVTVNTYSHNGTIGSRISYNCEPGLIPDKPQTAICQSDGSWFPDPINLECQNNTHNGNRNCSLPNSVNADSIQNHINGSLVAIFNCSGVLIKTVCTTEGIWDVDITKVEHECQKNRLQELEENNIVNGELPIIVATAAAGTGVIIVLLIIIILLIIAAVKLAQSQGKERNEVMNLYADPVRVDGRNTMSDFHLDGEDTIEDSSDHYEEVSDLTMREIHVYAELEPDPNNHPLNMAAPDHALVEYASLNHLSLGENSESSMSNRIPPQLSSKWHELGTAIGMDKQSLNNLLEYDPEYCMQQVFEYWKENVNGKLTWGKLAEILETIELRSLSESITEEHINELDCEVNHNIVPISV